MAVLLIILFITIGLAVRATASSRTRISEGETGDELTPVDMYARSFILVLLSLLGLLALGVMYGNVLGAAHLGH